MDDFIDAMTDAGWTIEVREGDAVALTWPRTGNRASFYLRPSGDVVQSTGPHLDLRSIHRGLDQESQVVAWRTWPAWRIGSVQSSVTVNDPNKNHLKPAGPVETPRPTKKTHGWQRLLLVSVGLGAVLGLVVLVGMAWGRGDSSTVQSGSVPTYRFTGIVTAHYQDADYDGLPAGCEIPADNIQLLDGKNDIIASGAITRRPNGYSNAMGGICSGTWSFQVPQSDFYQVRIGQTPGPSMSFGDMKQQNFSLQLCLGYEVRGSTYNCG